MKSVSFRREWPRGWTRIGALPRSSGVATLPHPTPHTAWRPTHRQFPLCTGRTETGCAPHSSARRREGGSRSVLPREGGDGVRQPGQACCRAAYVAYIRCANTTMGRSGKHRGGTGVPHLVMGETPTPNEVRPPWGWRTATLGWVVTAMYHIRPSALTGVMLEASLSYIRYRGAERCRLGRGRTWLQRAHPAAWLSCVARGWTVTTQ